MRKPERKDLDELDEILARLDVEREEFKRRMAHFEGKRAYDEAYDAAMERMNGG